MKSVLVTGGTVFVSRFTAEYFAQKGWDTYVLNRGSRPQSAGVHWICADRHNLGDTLKKKRFDAVLDVTAYTAQDVNDLLDGLGSFDDYVFISSSAVYPEWAQRPFAEETPTGENKIWDAYGKNKIAAENALHARVPGAYILRPPYLYGPMNNVYREAFVFDCAMADKPFYLPGDGSMQLQFFHVEDLCRMMEMLLLEKPAQKVYNVGNTQLVSVRDWVTLCYRAADKTPSFVQVTKDVDPRQYFCFYDYEYELDVGKQQVFLKETKTLLQGLQEALSWYMQNADLVRKKPLLQFIQTHFE